MEFNKQIQQQQNLSKSISNGSVSSIRGAIPSDESEWVLFSPINSINNEDDILSSSIGTTNVRAQVDDENDSIIDSFNEEFIANESTDLETRINNWRKQQINDLINETTMNKSMSKDKLEFMKSWGIDDGKIKLKNKRKYKLPPIDLENLYYGSDLLKNYNDKDIKIIRSILCKLSKELTINDISNDNWNDLNNHKQYIKQLLNPHNNINSDNNEILNNKDLEKFLPLFLKNLIIENKNQLEFKRSHSELNSNKFWENDFKSCNSSILSISTNSLFLNFNLQEFA